jgi:hypothetical protein
MLLTLVIVALLIPATAMLIHQFVRGSLDIAEPRAEAAQETPQHEFAEAA